MLTIVVGGFFGDEGKGKVVAYLAQVDDLDIAIRCGAVNAGHTVIKDSRVWKLRIIPSAFVNKRTKLLIAPGALVRLDVLFKEIEDTDSRDRVFLDRNTGIIEPIHVEKERLDHHLAKSIGSTLQGVGAAMSDRVLRRLKLAKEFDELKDMVIDVALEVNNAIDRGSKVLIEGTQGTFLSLYHGTYPYVTSRDTIASAFASEVGVGPKKVDEVIVVFKSYVTRVGGGPLENELPIEEAIRRGWVERATVTGRIRRVAPFNTSLAKRAIMLNSATQIALTKIDALYPEAQCVKEWSKLPIEARRWIDYLENELGIPISLISTGADVSCMIDRRRELGLVR